MSFPKAKIVRYYDDVSCAPPPGKYDPKVDSKVKGVVLDKSQRFNTPKLEHGSSVESLDSACSSTKTPIFRTPSKRLPKKGPMSTPRSIKCKIPLPDKLYPSQITEDNNKRLIEEINELTRVHQNQLLEKNEEIAALAEQVNSLNNELSKLMTAQIDPAMKSEYEMEINKLRKQLIDLNSTLEANEINYKNQVEELKCQLLTLEENLSNHVSISKELEDSLVENNVVFQEINDKISQMAEDFNHKLNQYVESVNKVDNFNKSLMKDYEAMMELLQKEADENIETKRSLVKLQETVYNLRDDLDNAYKRCKMYEVVQATTSETVNVLSKRLTECDAEVDSLKNIQQDLLFKKSQLEDQVKDLSEENAHIKECMESLQLSFMKEADDLKIQLIEKLECYKEFALAESEKQKALIIEKQDTIDILLEVMETMKCKAIELDAQLAKSQARVCDYEEEISNLKTTLLERETDFEEKLGAQKALFAQISHDYENLKEVFHQEKQELELQVSDLHKSRTDLRKQITDLELDLEKKNHKITQDQNKIIERLKDEIAKIREDKNSLIESHEKDCNSIQNKYEAQTRLVAELKKELKKSQETHQKYMDEVIAELVLEKERVTELTNCIDNLKLDKENDFGDNNFELEKLRKLAGEQAELIQLFEYERIAQEFSFQEFLDHKDELVKTIERQNREISVLSETADKHYNAKRQLEQEITRLNEEREQLKDSGNEDSMKVTSLEARIADLECRNRELTDIIGPFKSQLIQFDLERNFLLNKTENTEKELRALELEHAKSLGHQNHKQKIKHVVNLKQNIVDLKKEVEKYRLENIKLRHELTSQKPSTFNKLKKNKENTRPKETQRTKSPATALKYRNG